MNRQPLFSHTIRAILTASILCGCLESATLSYAQEMAATWWRGYKEVEASGPDVLGYWKFDGEGDQFTRDHSSHEHKATLRGAVPHAKGRFGGCLESGAGYPVADKSHSIHVARSPVLSPQAAFSVELWIRPKPQLADVPRPVLMDTKYVAYDHSGFMLTLPKAGAAGSRQLAVEIGMGDRSDHWFSRPFELREEKWQHLAFTYDARGTVSFYLDGTLLGRVTQPECGPMAPATRALAIGDRIGSLYNGFPGYIDEVRMTRGERDFRPIKFEPTWDRVVVVRMSARPSISGALINQTDQPLSGTMTAWRAESFTTDIPFPALAPKGRHDASFLCDASLKPGVYEVEVRVKLPAWEGNASGYEASAFVPLVIVPRPLPQRLPVVMWGVGGTDDLVREIPRLKEIGFTHCLGLRIDYQRIWDQGAEALPGDSEQVRNGRAMLNAALENDIQVVSSLSPASWLRNAAVGQPFRRVDRKGEPYAREDVIGIAPPIQQFCFNSGAAMRRAYGDHPAYAAALLHTEVRGESQVSFHPSETQAYRKATGLEIPAEVQNKNGVQYKKLPEFPKNRVIPDDHPILRYYQWFWQHGDGWNDLNTQLHEGLRRDGRDDFWTFHDPAVRVPSISGSGGQVDVLSHWTYSYPDPIRIGLCCDELFEMARANGHDQDVMKMTQLIWYRSQTAPINATPSKATSPWVDQDPDAAYITIAPMHLREAFWWSLARPIKGLMYHGWQSLVPMETPAAYRYTNPSTQGELKRLIQEVVVPLGPTLVQVPEPRSDIAMLESFTSQMFATRGTYGWNHSWAGDLYHVLMYAQLQPRVLYEESLLKGGLQGTKILVLADCDVLTKSVVKAIQEFQNAGGIVIGDSEVCPAIQLDHTIPRLARSGKADADRAMLLEAAGQLREWLDPRYVRELESSNPDVVTRRRRYGSTDYLFAVNDRREFGRYVGGFGRVMEDGLPSQTTLRLNRTSGHVYDLLAHRPLATRREGKSLEVDLQLGPCQGRLLMVTPTPILRLGVSGPEEARTGLAVDLSIEVTDGKAAIDAVIPLEVKIRDPEGVEAERSGFYGAAGGKLALRLDLAPNDRPGLWEVEVRELAAGTVGRCYVRVRGAEDKVAKP